MVWQEFDAVRVRVSRALPQAASTVWRTLLAMQNDIFYPRNAMLARVLAMAPCPSVCLCLSVCH